MSSLGRPGYSTLGTPVDPASPSGILIDPTTEIGGSPALNDVLKGDGLGGWTVGPAPGAGGITYKGTWDASTNTPALASGVGTPGDYYIVAVGGTTTLDGVSLWTVGDWAIFNGTAWQKIDNDTRPDYGPLAADPAGTSPDGSKYYNTALDMEMRYDATRAKWVSVEAKVCTFSNSGFFGTAAGAYYRGIGAVTGAGATGYLLPHNATVVAMGYTRTDTDAATFEVMDDGASVATLASSAASGKSTALNVDIASDSVLSLRNQSGGNTTSGVQAWVKVRWRA